MKTVASLGAKWQRKQKNLKSLHVLSASIRIRKCTCHSEDRQTVNKVTLTAQPTHTHTAAKEQPNKNEVKRPWNRVKVHIMTKRWYTITKRCYNMTKRCYNMTKRSILFNSTTAAMPSCLNQIRTVPTTATAAQIPKRGEFLKSSLTRKK